MTAHRGSRKVSVVTCWRPPDTLLFKTCERLPLLLSFVPYDCLHITLARSRIACSTSAAQKSEMLTSCRLQALCLLLPEFLMMEGGGSR